MSRVGAGIVVLLVGGLGIVLAARSAQAGGGVVKLKTDNGCGGYYYNVLGAAPGRYAALYTVDDFAPNALLCGIRRRDLDQSIMTPGVDAYTLGADVRFPVAYRGYFSHQVQAEI